METSKLYLVSQEVQVTSCDWPLKLKGQSCRTDPLTQDLMLSLGAPCASSAGLSPELLPTENGELPGGIKKQAPIGPCFLAHQAPLYLQEPALERKVPELGPAHACLYPLDLAYTLKCGAHSQFMDNATETQAHLVVTHSHTATRRQGRNVTPTLSHGQVCSLHWKNSDEPAHCPRNVYNAIQMLSSQ